MRGIRDRVRGGGCGPTLDLGRRVLRLFITPSHRVSTHDEPLARGEKVSFSLRRTLAALLDSGSHPWRQPPLPKGRRTEVEVVTTREYARVLPALQGGQSHPLASSHFRYRASYRGLPRYGPMRVRLFIPSLSERGQSPIPLPPAPPPAGEGSRPIILTANPRW